VFSSIAGGWSSKSKNKRQKKISNDEGKKEMRKLRKRRERPTSNIQRQMMKGRGGLRTKDQRLKQTMLTRATVDVFGHLVLSPWSRN